MSADDITIGEHGYRIEGRLSAMEQFHVTRRLGPALVICGVTFRAMLEGEVLPLEHWMAVAGPIMEVVSAMEDEDVEYVILRSLRVCRRRQGDAWAPMLAADGKTMMFQDLDQFDIIRLTVEVLRRNLAGFMKGLDGAASTTAGSPTSPSTSTPPA